MNVLISISNEIYRHAKDGSEDSNDEWNAMRAIANGTPILDNATRYDIAKLFYGTDDAIDLFNELQMGKDWWNAKYQKGGKE